LNIALEKEDIVWKVLSAIYTEKDTTQIEISAIYDRNRYNSEFDLWYVYSVRVEDSKL